MKRNERRVEMKFHISPRRRKKKKIERHTREATYEEILREEEEKEIVENVCAIFENLQIICNVLKLASENQSEKPLEKLGEKRR